ncbi:MAG: histidinol-phosphate transaminase [Bacillota bacterium]
MALIHGGDAYGFMLEHGKAPLDFSANCNPLGVPSGVREAIRNAAATADAYPDPLCRELRIAIAQSMNLPPSQIQCGNGAADIIFRLVLAKRPKRALLAVPTFLEYELALGLVGCDIIRFPLKKENGFKLDEQILDLIDTDVDLMFLCNPNNPTGLTVGPELLRRILDAAHKAGTLLVVDECFNGFLAEPQFHSLRTLVPSYNNLFVLDAFTKLYGIAGVRLGYCLCGDEELLASILDSGAPWSVSSLAQAAGIAALKENTYLLKMRALIRAEKVYLCNNLMRCGIKIIGSEANYLFFHTGLPDLKKRLGERGLLIRDCSNYPGLTQGYYRIAVRSRTDNERLLQAISDLAEAAHD